MRALGLFAHLPIKDIVLKEKNVKYNNDKWPLTLGRFNFNC
jgi:hypothetical protein